jgi:hypothetical protein
MRANEFIAEGSNTSLENAINKMAYGYVNGRSAEKNTCYSYVGEQLARIKPDDATIRFWGRKPNLIVHGDAVLPNGRVISTASPDNYEKFGYELVDAMPLKELLAKVSPDENLDEMALPADWDPTALGHDKTFKSRLEYALQRVRRLGGGSSRVAFVMPDQGRSTVLKIAKNRKGLAQNQAEADILDDGYIGKLDIVIPLIDYDKTTREPVWIQTELAQKVSESALCKLLKCKNLTQFVGYTNYLIGGKNGHMWKTAPTVLANSGFSEQDIETFKEYASELGDLVSSSGALIVDFQHAGNWGIYNGRPVIIDVGFTENVASMYR